MTTRTFFKPFVIIALLAFLACEHESADNEITITDPLHGTWNLVNVTSGWGATDFEIGDITWTIDTENMTITTASSINPESTSVYVNGTFEYTVYEDDNENRILTGLANDESGNVVFHPVFGAITELNDQTLVIDRSVVAFDSGVSTYIKD